MFCLTPSLIAAYVCDPVLQDMPHLRYLLRQLGCIECLQLPMIADAASRQRCGYAKPGPYLRITQHDQRFSLLDEPAPDLRLAYLASCGVTPTYAGEVVVIKTISVSLISRPMLSHHYVTRVVTCRLSSFAGSRGM